MLDNGLRRSADIIQGVNTGFRLTTTASPAWVHLVRRLVAVGVTGQAYDIDRLDDLLLATSQIAGDFYEHPGLESVTVSITITDEGVEFSLDSEGTPGELSPVSQLVLSSLTTDSWQESHEHGARVGFRFV